MRFPDWPERMQAYIAARAKRVFEWGKGKHDCCSFALGHAENITGVDAMADIAEYVSADEADLVLAEHPVRDFMDAHFARRAAPSLGQRGDIAICTLKGHDSLMIVEGALMVGPGLRRLERVPLTEAEIVWAV